jgi:hypothetical protein
MSVGEKSPLHSLTRQKAKEKRKLGLRDRRLLFFLSEMSSANNRGLTGKTVMSMTNHQRLTARTASGW